LSLVLFYILAGAILVAALMVVMLRNVFHSALFLVLTFFLVAGIYLMLGAEFLAAVQVLIYVGAITILILFALMLTHKIYSAAIRQVNEQVVPAAIIAVLFLVLAIFTVVKTFNGSDAKIAAHAGAWTASLDLSIIPAQQSRLNWTVDIEDNSGQSYVAGGFFSLIDQPSATRVLPMKPDPNTSGYILSASPDYSTIDRIFSRGQSAYIKVWSDKVDYGSVSNAVWTIFSDDGKKIAIKLSNSNTETIGRLLMSRFALPFEVVSVLLLASLIGAIVIARKDS